MPSQGPGQGLGGDVLREETTWIPSRDSLKAAPNTELCSASFSCAHQTSAAALAAGARFEGQDTGASPAWGDFTASAEKSPRESPKMLSEAARGSKLAPFRHEKCFGHLERLQNSL